MDKIIYFYTVIVLLLFTSCSQVKVETEVKDDSQLIHYKKALSMLKKGLYDAEAGKTDDAKESIDLATESLLKFFSNNSDIEQKYKSYGLKFLYEDLTPNEKELYDKHIASEEKKDEIVVEESPPPPKPSDNLEEPPKPLTEPPIKTYLTGRIKQLKSKSNCKIGIVVKSLEKHETYFEENGNICFIPASLTKIVLSFALIEKLKEISQNSDISETFQNEVKLQSIQEPAFQNQLSDLFKRLNTYTLKEAPDVNRIADETGFFLENLYVKDGETISFSKILLKHLKKVSKIKKCNFIDKASGLSTKNYLTPLQISDCLTNLKNYNFYVKSLMVPGTGMLSSRLLDVKEKCYFKTGSLQNSGVLCLAGYIKLKNDFICIVFIINNINQNFQNVVKWLDDSVRGIIDSYS
ncbi:MAG: D-alanyl-D-alanine carboxypeptidase [Desulfobacterales bacterium]|nr:D-alanyl-D-alanine carboxypeptidase [Desulfobacterales bacterium]